MSECTWTLDGPPKEWTASDIRQHNINLGLEEVKDIKARITEEIDRQNKEGEIWGFYKDRVWHIKDQEEKLAGSPIAFFNPRCPFCAQFRDKRQRVCLLVWKTKNGYKSKQCNSAYYG